MVRLAPAAVHLVANYREGGAGTYLGMLPGLFCGAVVLTWLYDHTGSVLLAAFWHGLHNVASGTQAAAGTVAAVVTTLVMAQAVLLVGWEVRAHRRGTPVLGAPAAGARR